MSRVKNMSFCGQTYRIIKNAIGQGGQGTVHQARSNTHTDQLAIIKEMPSNKVNQKRLKHLIENQLGYTIPGLSVPLALADKNRDQKLWYIAPFGTGVALDEDKPRGFIELLEIAILLVTIWQRLEAKGIAHGDIAPSNILIANDGDIQIIDVDNFETNQTGVPHPQMIGQHAMIAPELRLSRNNSGTAHPNIETDRFAWGILLNLLLLGRHPADGILGENPSPADFDMMMLSGDWPENQRVIQAGEIPNEVLGKELIAHFQLAFLTDPYLRPDAESWRLTFIDSLLRTHTHQCGGSFVMDQGQTKCPWCKKKVSQQKTHTTTVDIVFTNIKTGKEERLSIPNGAFVYLGRATLPDASSYVSNKHIRLYRQGEQLYIKHVGKNMTTIQFSGEQQAYNLSSHRFSIHDIRSKNIQLMVADTQLELDILIS